MRMKEWLESWRAVATLIAMVVAGTVWVTDGISDLRLEVVALETRIEGRLSAVEAKLDLLIEALEIRAGDDQ